MGVAAPFPPLACYRQGGPLHLLVGRSSPLHLFVGGGSALAASPALREGCLADGGVATSLGPFPILARYVPPLPGHHWSLSCDPLRMKCLLLLLDAGLLLGTADDDRDCLGH